MSVTQVTTFEIRKETTFSYYEVSEYEEIPDSKGNRKLISSHWECIYHTENWGDFTSAIKRITGFNATEYRRQKDEEAKSWLKRLDFLSNLLQDQFNIKTELTLHSFKIIIIVDSKNTVRPPYVFKNAGAPKSVEDSD
jgi:hypothetical protein